MPFYNELRESLRDKEKLNAILGIFNFVTIEFHKKGKVIFREGETNCTAAYVVIKGRVGVLRKDSTVSSSDPKRTENRALPRESSKEESPISAQSVAGNQPVSPFPKKNVQSGDPQTLFKQVAGRAIAQKLLQAGGSGGSSHRKSFSARNSGFIKALLMKQEGGNSEKPNGGSVDEQGSDSPVVGLPQYIINDEIYDDVDYEVKTIIPTLGKMIAKILQGKIFGTVALTSNAPRNASILTLDDTYLMVINKKEFELIKEFYSDEIEERRHFLSNVLPQLDTVKDIRTLNKLLQFFEVASFPRVNSLG
jgi:CRP-like cAMP-binding protein